VCIDFDPVYVTVMAASREVAQDAVDEAAVIRALRSGPLCRNGAEGALTPPPRSGGAGGRRGVATLRAPR